VAATIGSPGPGFALKDQDGNEVTLDDLKGKKSLIVFIPFPFTGICQGELCDIRDNLHQLESFDANVVAITCDTRPANKAWSEDQGFGFRILSDFWPHGLTAQAYGCFNETTGSAMRSTYVLDADGIVRDIIATDALSDPRNVSDYPKALAAIE
jgi:peroxiredoxin (alkyl hydroperoxide reductase subunit C)